MNEAEKLLEKFARKNMVRWDQESFKRTHSRLHKSIIEALTEALRIHDVVGRSEQLKDLLEKLLENNMCSHAGDELIKEVLKGF